MSSTHFQTMTSQTPPESMVPELSWVEEFVSIGVVVSKGKDPYKLHSIICKETCSLQTVATMQSMAEVHIPLALGAIGVFHSVPTGEIGGSLKLDACLLAKIFSGQVETWDHADIKA